MSQTTDVTPSSGPMPPESESGGLELIAYHLGYLPPLRIVPAAPERAWMDATHDRFAYRCLPLLMANQSGWLVLSSHSLRAIWDGGDAQAGLRIEYLGGGPPYPAVSHFGHGILTWHLPYVFRTPPGYNLLVRGPANWPKDGIQALEGVVETDWATVTFTMNWKMTRADLPVTFDVGEPICMLVPQRRAELESFRPAVRDIETAPDVAAGYRRWSQARSQFLADLPLPGTEANRTKWQKDYFRGRSPGAPAAAAPEHQTRRHLRAFEQDGN